jgi:ribosomal protein uL24
VVLDAYDQMRPEKRRDGTSTLTVYFFVLQAVTSNRNKSRKAHFTAHSEKRRVIMSSPLSKELQKKHNVRSMTIRKGDTVKIVRGDENKKDGKEVKVTAVYRKKFVIHVADLTKNKANGTYCGYFRNSDLLGGLTLYG